MCKKTYLIYAAVLLAASCLLSCEKEPEVYSTQEIYLDVAPGATTKGFLNANDLTQNGTKFRVFDYLSGYSGEIDGHENGEEYQFFTDDLTFKSDAATWKWLFGDVNTPTSYHWTRTGVHHFFGWLLADGHDALTLTTQSFFDTYTPGSKTVYLAKTIGQSAPQYDFMYSDVIPVDIAQDGIPNKVDMPMRHLFGAVGMTVSNTSDSDVTVYWVKLLNFPNSGNATLNYDMENGVSLVQPDPSASGLFWPNTEYGTPITLPNKNASNAGKVYDTYDGQEVTENHEPTYRISWPMSLAAVAPIVDHINDDGSFVLTANSPKVEVRYRYGNNTPKTVYVPFPTSENPVAAITAGRRTRINLSFDNKHILLSYDILPWKYEEFPMEFEDDAISSTQLKFTENTYEAGSKEYETNPDGSPTKHEVVKLISGSIAGGWIAKGKFKIYTPVNATLSVGLGGDADSFIVELDSGDHPTGIGGGNSTITIDPKRDNGLITLTIRPNGTAVSGRRVYLHFAVRNNGRDASADTEINRDNYIVMIP